MANWKSSSDGMMKMGGSMMDMKKKVGDKMEGMGRKIRAGAGSLISDIKKNGFHPMNDAGIYNKGKK